MKSRFPSRSKTESYAAGVKGAENEHSFGKNYRYANEVTDSYAASVNFAKNTYFLRETTVLSMKFALFRFDPKRSLMQLA